ncbi:hypothetical protein [Paraburkholderia antibiotica]|uniref:Uncharacterized protein n=1 Tax=Paraburkholderia antibiotica TaxID=2728839 RepID=A0A7X9X5Y7_9BURK|nr:hypothetical protein [Paraburkholderia antibiotica]NML32010.1 hypothetical protein [Paraburkholderia antibiotica]
MMKPLIKKTLTCLALTLPLTLLVAIGITGLQCVNEWLDRGDGYDFFKPLFKTFGAFGSEGHSDVIFGTLYIVSFFVSLVFVVVAWSIASYWRRKRHS